MSKKLLKQIPVTTHCSKGYANLNETHYAQIQEVLELVAQDLESNATTHRDIEVTFENCRRPDWGSKLFLGALKDAIQLNDIKAQVEVSDRLTGSWLFKQRIYTFKVIATNYANHSHS